MKTIKIDESVLDMVPEVFKNLPNDVDYKLTKTENTRNGFVFVGDTSIGTLSIVNIIDKPGVRVVGGFKDYLRTSPIVEVIDSTDTTITFRTEGGVYKLEKQNEEET